MKYLIVIFFFIFSISTFADQTKIPDYTAAVDTLWNKLYKNGNWTLYCGFRFEQKGQTTDLRPVNFGHIYAQSWMADHLGCESVAECRTTHKRFGRMSADLHNIYPALKKVNFSREDKPFGNILGNVWRYEDCDFENTGKLVEPRPEARGNIARAIFYMHKEYRLPIKYNMLKTLQQWNREDPPSCYELRRNNRIEELQGTRNRFIDHPGQAEKL